MPASDPTWGLVSTIRAPAAEILRFAAYHLDLGAHRLHLYLDAPNPEGLPALQAHPKIRVITCDETYWKRRKRDRPPMHQMRQTLNATHAYSRTQVTWLAHIDVDEFIWPETDLTERLTALPDDTACARMRPIESLPDRPSLYKGFIPSGPDRDRIVRGLYPTYGAYVKGGFMSHVAGKIFARTGLDMVRYRIHNVYVDGCKNPGQIELPDVDLCHHHGHTWQAWRASFDDRLEKGSYRPDLAPNLPPELGGLSMHDLFTLILQNHGETGLRQAFDELAARDNSVFARLRAGNWIKTRDLQLDRKIAKHFPDAATSVAG